MGQHLQDNNKEAWVLFTMRAKKWELQCHPGIKCGTHKAQKAIIHLTICTIKDLLHHIITSNTMDIIVDQDTTMVLQGTMGTMDITTDVTYL
jgi:hypothetical protein